MARDRSVPGGPDLDRLDGPLTTTAGGDMRGRSHLITAALVLAGCTASGGGQAAAPPPTAQPPTAEASEAGTEADVADVTDCSDADARAIDEVIDAQLAAFAADDWERGLGFATQEFQRSVDAQQLADIVTREYPGAADATGHTAQACVVADDAAQMVVDLDVTDGTEAQLLYMLEREGGQWRISGAVGHGPPPEVTA